MLCTCIKSYQFQFSLSQTYHSRKRSKEVKEARKETCPFKMKQEADVYDCHQEIFNQGEQELIQDGTYREH